MGFVTAAVCAVASAAILSFNTLNAWGVGVTGVGIYTGVETSNLAASTGGHIAHASAGTTHTTMLLAMKAGAAAGMLLPTL